MDQSNNKEKKDVLNTRGLYIQDTFPNRLAKAMKMRGMKQVELAEKTGINKSKISSYLSGRYKAKQDGIYALATALNINAAWLMGFDVDANLNNYNETHYNLFKAKPKPAIVLIYGAIPAGIPMEMIENIVDTEEIDSDMLKGGKQFFGLKIKGNSMYPEYMDGDTIILEKVEDVESGSDAVIMINGNDGTFKRVFKNENGIVLQPLNSEFQPLIYSNKQIEELPVKIIGKVVELRRKK